MKTLILVVMVCVAGCGHATTADTQHELTPEQKTKKLVSVCTNLLQRAKPEETEQIMRWCNNRAINLRAQGAKSFQYPIGYAIAGKVLSVIKPGPGPFVPPDPAEYVKQGRQIGVIRTYAQPEPELPPDRRIGKSLRAGCIPCTPPCVPICQ